MSENNTNETDDDVSDADREKAFHVDKKEMEQEGRHLDLLPVDNDHVTEIDQHLTSGDFTRHQTTAFCDKQSVSTVNGCSANSDLLLASEVQSCDNTNNRFLTSSQNEHTLDRPTPNVGTSESPHRLKTSSTGPSEAEESSPSRSDCNNSPCCRMSDLTVDPRTINPIICRSSPSPNNVLRQLHSFVATVGEATGGDSAGRRSPDPPSNQGDTPTKFGESPKSLQPANAFHSQTAKYECDRGMFSGIKSDAVKQPNLPKSPSSPCGGSTQRRPGNHHTSSRNSLIDRPCSSNQTPQTLNLMQGSLMNFFQEQDQPLDLSLHRNDTTTDTPMNNKPTDATTSDNNALLYKQSTALQKFLPLPPYNSTMTPPNRIVLNHARPMHQMFRFPAAAHHQVQLARTRHASSVRPSKCHAVKSTETNNQRRSSVVPPPLQSKRQPQLSSHHKHNFSASGGDRARRGVKDKDSRMLLSSSSVHSIDQHAARKRWSSGGGAGSSAVGGKPLAGPAGHRGGHSQYECSCGVAFETLYLQAVHMEATGHCPSRKEASMTDTFEYQKLVRGQDLWLNYGSEQAREILRCMRCQRSFESLSELTLHMIRTKHYEEIVGSSTNSTSTSGSGILSEKQKQNHQVVSSEVVPSSVPQRHPASSAAVNGTNNRVLRRYNDSMCVEKKEEMDEEAENNRKKKNRVLHPRFSDPLKQKDAITMDSSENVYYSKSEVISVATSSPDGEKTDLLGNNIFETDQRQKCMEGQGKETKDFKSTNDKAATLKVTDDDTVKEIDNVNLMVTDDDTVNVTDNVNLMVTDDDTVKVTDNVNLMVTDDDTVKVIDNVNLMVTDTATFEMTNDDNRQIEDSAIVKVTDDTILKVSDNETLTITEDANLHETDGNTLRVNDEATMKVTDEVTIKVIRDVTLTVTDDVTINATDDTSLEATDTSVVVTGDAAMKVTEDARLEVNDGAIVKVIADATLNVTKNPKDIDAEIHSVTGMDICGSSSDELAMQKTNSSNDETNSNNREANSNNSETNSINGETNSNNYSEANESEIILRKTVDTTDSNKTDGSLNDGRSYSAACSRQNDSLKRKEIISSGVLSTELDDYKVPTPKKPKRSVVLEAESDACGFEDGQQTTSDVCKKSVESFSHTSSHSPEVENSLVESHFEAEYRRVISSRRQTRLSDYVSNSPDGSTCSKTLCTSTAQSNLNHFVAADPGIGGVSSSAIDAMQQFIDKSFSASCKDLSDSEPFELKAKPETSREKQVTPNSASSFPRWIYGSCNKRGKESFHQLDSGGIGSRAEQSSSDTSSASKRNNKPQLIREFYHGRNSELVASSEVSRSVKVKSRTRHNNNCHAADQGNSSDHKLIKIEAYDQKTTASVTTKRQDPVNATSAVQYYPIPEIKESARSENYQGSLQTDLTSRDGYRDGYRRVNKFEDETNGDDRFPSDSASPLIRSASTDSSNLDTFEAEQHRTCKTYKQREQITNEEGCLNLVYKGAGFHDIDAASSPSPSDNFQHRNKRLIYSGCKWETVDTIQAQNKVKITRTSDSSSQDLRENLRPRDSQNINRDQSSSIKDLIKTSPYVYLPLDHSAIFTKYTSSSSSWPTKESRTSNNSRSHNSPSQSLSPQTVFETETLQTLSSPKSESPKETEAILCPNSTDETDEGR